MAITLPLAAENYLTECGLTSVEILLIKKLLEENRLTIRGLASKTGKGSSAIDAALKKLIQRGIVHKEKVNDQPRYTVIGPQAIVAWTEQTLKERSDMMKRRHQSFAQFIQSLTTENSHPVIEHYQGEEGISRAYDRLLEHRTELLTYFNPALAEDTESAEQFRKQFARRRQVYGTFQRVIAPNTPAGRRLQSRDPFEYRKTVLIPEGEYPLNFNKTIAGDVVACMDEKKKEASLIQFPLLAESEQSVFQRLWEQQLEKERQGNDVNVPHPEAAVSLREQIQSINGLQKICVGVYAFFLTYWLALFFRGTTFALSNMAYNLYGLPAIVFGAIGMRSIKRWGGTTTAIGKAMLCISLGITLWSIANLGWIYYNLVLNIPVPYPSVLDGFFLPGIFFCGLGIFYLSDATGAAHGLRSPHAKLFVLLYPIATLLISYYLFITVARDGVLVSRDGSAIKTILDIAYPLIDSLYLTAAVLISGLSFRYMRGAYVLDIWITLLGMFGMFIGDVIFVFTTTTGTFYPGNTGDLAYVSGLLFLSFGLMGFSRERKLTVSHS